MRAPVPKNSPFDQNHFERLEGKRLSKLAGVGKTAQFISLK